MTPPASPEVRRPVRLDRGGAAFWWTFAGVGAGHMIAGRPLMALGWFGLRIALPALATLVAVSVPSLAFVALLLGYLSGWLLFLPAALHARSLARSLEEAPGLGLAPAFAVLAFLALLVSTWTVRHTIARSYSIPSSSMAPTLLHGDHVLAASGVMQPPLEVGQLVFFHPPSDDEITYVKRVVGLPGDVLQFDQGRLYRNGVSLGEPGTSQFSYDDDCEPATGTHRREDGYSILTEEPGSFLSDAGPFEVPTGHVFVAGDNRDRSGDSRLSSVGPIAIDAIMGTGSSVWMSFDPCGGGGVRWSRVGARL